MVLKWLCQNRIALIHVLTTIMTFRHEFLVVMLAAVRTLVLVVEPPVAQLSGAYHTLEAFRMPKFPQGLNVGLAWMYVLGTGSTISRQYHMIKYVK